MNYDLQRIKKDIEELYLGNLKTVEFDLDLPKEGENGSTIEWISEHERFLSPEGKVTRPKFLSPEGKVTRPKRGVGDRKVLLHGIFRYGDEAVEKIYEVNILEEPDETKIVEIFPLQRNCGVGKEMSLPQSVVVKTVKGQILSYPVSWESGTDETKIVEIFPLQRNCGVGKEMSLPQSVVVKTVKGQILSYPVSWESGNRVCFSNAGTYEILGKVEETELSAKLIINVSEVYEEPKKDTKRLVRGFTKGEVKLLPGTVFWENRERDIEYLKSINADQMLYNFRKAAGLDTKQAPAMTGWDSPDGNLRGHTTGHYLSAIALCYRETKDEEVLKKIESTKQAPAMTGWDSPDGNLRGHTTGHYLSAIALCYRETKDEEVLKKIESMIDGLAECQEAFEGQEGFQEGYIGAYSEQQFDLLEQGAKYPEIWAPYYTLHKILAGLLDCYTYAGNETALQIALKSGKWVYRRLSRLTPEHRAYYTLHKILAGLLDCYTYAGNETALQIALKSGKWVYRRLSRLTPEHRASMWNMYIAGEFGGINETMARLYEISGEACYLECAKMFDNDKLFVPMEEKQDALERLHANQHIPQILGLPENLAELMKRWRDCMRFPERHVTWNVRKCLTTTNYLCRWKKNKMR